MEDIYVVVDLSNSHATVVAAQRDAEKKFKILASEEETYLAGSMKDGLVQKSEEVAAKVTSAISKLANRLNEPIHSYYVGLNCHTLRTRFFEVSRSFELGKLVTADDVKELKDGLLESLDENLELLGDAQFTCYWNDEIDENIIGRSAGVLKVKMAVPSVLKNKKSLNDNCLAQISRYNVAGLQIVPECFGEAITTVEDREAGCLVIDFAAACTSVAVYKNGNLLSFAVVPLGGYHITRDLETLGLTTPVAEKLKMKCDQLSQEKKLNLGGKIEVSATDVANITRARLNEILSFVLQQTSLVIDKKELTAGIFATGGVKKMKNFVKIVSELTEMEVHVANYNDNFVSNVAEDVNMNARLAGMLLKADKNCCGEVEKSKEKKNKGTSKNKRSFVDRVKGWSDSLFPQEED